MPHDPLWMRLLLNIHIAAGALSFVVAPVALAVAKGGVAHRRWGMIYLWSMGVVAGTALPMAVYRPVLFLALVAVFSFYAAFSGYRVTKLKALARGGSAQPIDWIAATITFCSSATLALLGAIKPHAVQDMGVVAVAFGFVGMGLACAEIVKFVKKPVDTMFWWYFHLGNMIGSYIAAWTAFSAITLSRFAGPTWLVWMWPSTLGAPAIALTIRHYLRKFAQRTGTVAA